MKRNKLFFGIICCLMAAVLGMSACSQNEATVTTTAVATTEKEAVTTAPKTTETTTAKVATAPGEEAPEEPVVADVTTVPGEEAPAEETTTASVTTADNSADTRSTQQKLDDLIAANPDVEIGYALVEAPTDYYDDITEGIWTYNIDKSVDVSGIITPFDLYRILSEEELSTEYIYYNENPLCDENSEIFRLSSLFFEDPDSGKGQYSFTLAELIRYAYSGDGDARLIIEHNYGVSEGIERQDNVLGQRLTSNYDDIMKETTLIKLLQQWRMLYGDYYSSYTSQDKKELTQEVLSGTPNAYFYEGTGNVAMHLGDYNTSWECYDSGVFNVNGEDYIFVIYTKNSSSDARTDLVSEISRILYDDVAK